MTAFLSIINELFKYAKAGKLEEKIYASTSRRSRRWRTTSTATWRSR